jgi:hypothetical protein
MPGVENVLKIGAGSGSHDPADYVDGSVLAELRRMNVFAPMRKRYGL